jgi:hypothetical protein
MPRTSMVHVVTAIGIDMGKNTLDMVGLDSRGGGAVHSIPSGLVHCKKWGCLTLPNADFLSGAQFAATKRRRDQPQLVPARISRSPVILR